MNATEHAEAHAAESRRTAGTWQRYVEPHAAAQAKARQTEADAGGDALRRSLEHRRELPVNG